MLSNVKVYNLSYLVSLFQDDIFNCLVFSIPRKNQDTMLCHEETEMYCEKDANFQLVSSKFVDKYTFVNISI